VERVESRAHVAERVDGTRTSKRCLCWPWSRCMQASRRRVKRRARFCGTTNAFFLAENFVSLVVFVSSA